MRRLFVRLLNGWRRWQVDRLLERIAYCDVLVKFGSSEFAAGHAADAAALRMRRNNLLRRIEESKNK